jgi:hypothetical protein
LYTYIELARLVLFSQVVNFAVTQQIFWLAKVAKIDLPLVNSPEGKTKVTDFAPGV